MIDTFDLWFVIILLGLGSFGLRFMFHGVLGDRELPEWVLRHLRYTAVAVIPGLIAPLILWPPATNGQIDLPRLGAACATLVSGLVTKNVFLSIAIGAATLYGLLHLG